MKSERSWAGIICGFVLFIVVCLSLLLHMKGAFRASGNPELGLLFFLLPGAAASCLSPGRRVLRPLLGAILAAPVSHGDDAAVLRDPPDVLAGDGVGVERRVLVRAWGIVLFCLSAPGLIPGAVIHRANKLTQANRPRFSFAQASKSVQPPMCFWSTKICGTVSTGLPTVFFQVSFADAFGMNIHVAVVEIITLVGQFSASSLARTQ